MKFFIMPDISGYGYLMLQLDDERCIYESNNLNFLDYLTISKQKYIETMIKNNAIQPYKDKLYYFTTCEDAQNAINEFEPYLIMKALVGDYNE